MKIRSKTLLILLLTTITLMSAIYEISQQIMLDSISVSENKEAELNVQRFVNNLNLALQNINSTGNDWASWDDTYQFIENNNTAYIESNLPDQTFIHLNLNLIFFINQSRQVIFGKAFDIENQTVINLPDAQISQIVNNDFLYTNETTQSEGGLILLDGIPTLVISQPILTSSDEGPVRGTLIMGRFMDISECYALEQAVGLPIETFAIDGSSTIQIPVDFQVASRSLSPTKPVFTQATNETSMAGYVLLNDVSGIPNIITKIDSYRTAYLQAKTSLNYLLVSFAILGIVIFAATTILLDKVVISRVSKLTKDVTDIDPKNEKINFVNVKGNDELSNLGYKINGMITAVQDSRDKIKKYSLTLENKVEERTLDLKKSQEKLKSIFDASPDAILALDLQNNITECNKQIYQTSGYSREDLVGKQAATFMSETDYTSILDRLDKNNDGGSALHVECNIIRKNKSVYPAELTIGSLLDAEGASFGRVVIIRDLTEKKELEKKLSNSRRLAAIGELAGMVGHDLRNPLAAIKNAVYFIKKKGTSIQPEQAKTMLDTIEAGISHSDKIINDLLDYSRNMHLELQVISVGAVFTDALTMVKIPENVKVINKVPEEITFKIDKHKIERVFINLVKNAVDAMPNGGTITLSCNKTNNNVDITVEDIGTGILENVLPNIFSPLFTTKAQGMGFGLSICKRIIEAHDGLITVKTEKDKGTKFTITLPIETKQSTEEVKDWITVPKQSGTMR